MLVMNEKIKAKELELTGLDGEPLGVVSRDEALAMAKRLKVDLVCTSLHVSIVRRKRSTLKQGAFF